MCKAHVQHAFRRVWVRPADWDLLGYKFDGHFYYDVVLPFGCRFFSYLFCKISEAVRWITFDELGHSDVLVYCDDFLNVENSHAWKKNFDELAVFLAAEKTIFLTTKLTFSGISIASTYWTLSLPAAILIKIISNLELWKLKHTCSLTKLQSLIGSI